MAAVLAALLLALSATACGTSAAPAAAPPPPPWFDPPLGFGEQSGRIFSGPGTRVSVGDPDDLPAALAGDTVWTSDGGRLDRVDAAGTATPVALPPGRRVAGRPLVDPPEGVGTRVERILAGAATVIPGSGTTPPGLAAEVVAVDPVTAAVTGVVGAALPWSARPEAVRVRVPGVVTVTPPGGLPGSSASRRVAVLTVATDSRRTTLGVDVAAGRVVWSVDGVEATAVAGGTAFGTATPSGRTASYTPSSVVALDGATGGRRATVAENLRTPTVVAAGPALVAVGGRAATTSLFGVGATSLRLVGPDGGTVRSLDLGGDSAAAAPPRCVWDRATTTVCAVGPTLRALDATTGAPLWSLPDPAANRVAPSLATTWHGAVYGTTVNGPVVLDARTGTDRDTRPGIAPALVNGRLGVTVDRSSIAGIGGGAALHPAVR